MTSKLFNERQENESLALSLPRFVVVKVSKIVGVTSSFIACLFPGATIPVTNQKKTHVLIFGLETNRVGSIIILAASGQDATAESSKLRVI